MRGHARKKALHKRKHGDASNDFEARINNAPASWTVHPPQYCYGGRAVTSEVKSPLWLRLSEGLGASEAADVFRLHKADVRDKAAANAIAAEIRRLDAESDDALAH